MKKILLPFLFLSLLLFSATAQKIELSAAVYSGFAKFTGDAAASHSPIVINPLAANPNFTQWPYGTKPGSSIGAEVQATFVTKAKVLFMLATGYQRLGTQVNINEVDEYGVILNKYPASGKAKQHADYFTLMPLLGYRIKAGIFKIDLCGGFNFVFCNSSKEKGKATYSTNRTVETDADIQHLKNEAMPSFQTVLHYRKAAFIAGYQWGLKSYYGIYFGGPQPEAKLRFLKLGLSYRI